jgi:hypothetical protein
MIDHVVLAVPDLADGVAGFQRLTGVRPVMGVATSTWAPRIILSA